MDPHPGHGFSSNPCHSAATRRVKITRRAKRPNSKLTQRSLSQLQQDGHREQALQLEEATLQSNGCVKPSDKLGSLFSSCLLSVNEVTNFFGSKGKECLYCVSVYLCVLCVVCNLDEIELN